MRGDGRKEDRLRTPVSNLFQRTGTLLGMSLVVHDEVVLTELRSRPDLAIDSTSGRIGYVELKSPGKGTPDNWRPSAHDREQWEKLKVLPNLIYTDGSSWALYRQGELVGSVAMLVGDLAEAGAQLRPQDSALEHLFRSFLEWRPKDPRSLRAIVADVAPLCQLLRDQVLETLILERGNGRQPFTTLALEWTSILFPQVNPKETLDESQQKFADSYAQCVTFALLLAQVDGISFDGRTPTGIAEQLAKQHSLLGEALTILANPRWVGHLNVVDTLVRVIGNINWSQVRTADSDTYSRLYETFLEEYDHALRRRSGTYYTPIPVARAMVSFVDSVLKSRLGRARGFASHDVFSLDPSMGAGTFLAEIMENAAETLRQQRRSPAAHLRELFAKRLIGFEIQAAPFAVAELRLHAALRNLYQIDLPTEEPRYLTDTLDDPYLMAFELGQLYDVLKESRLKANLAKRDVPVMVVIGNPPWRENAKGAAKWIEEKRKPGRDFDIAKRPSLDEFRVGVPGNLSFNLNNMWTYFWRWSAWKAFEANEPAGVVALITPSPYLTSESYAGMRRYLRSTADEGWIIDLSPEQHRPDIRTRIFPETQHAICIGVFVRFGDPQPDVPATVHYRALPGSRQDKFDALDTIRIDDEGWIDCTNTWNGPFRPGNFIWQNYPALSEILPWQHSGVKSNRNWVWAPDDETLERRWKKLICADPVERKVLFKETRDRTLTSICKPIPGSPHADGTMASASEPNAPTVGVSFHSFDRQRLIFDARAVDFPRYELWQTVGPKQIYLCEQHAHPIDNGPGVVFTTLVPHTHNFNGRGGRVLPLYRDATGTVPNLPPRLCAELATLLCHPVKPEDVISYIACVTAHGGYTRRFCEELKTPGIRVPITTNKDLWIEAVETGRRVIWLHTFGERMVNNRQRRPSRLGTSRRAGYSIPVAGDNGQLPKVVDHEGEALIVGVDTLLEHAGRVEPVSRAVWEYQVGGVQVIKKWFSYRHPDAPQRRRTSPLDDINPYRWCAEFDDELLDMIEVLDGCVRLEPIQDELLARICAGPVLSLQDLTNMGVLPAPVEFQKPPRPDRDTLLE